MIDGKNLHPSSQIKYLGIIIDENLNWKHHVESICKKLRKTNGYFSILRRPTLISIYYALFHSHISYACQVWAQRENYITKRIFLLQKRDVRL